MTPKPKRRTLAERDAQAIQTPPRTKEPHPRGLQRRSLTAEPTTPTSPTKPIKATERKSGAPPTGRVDMTIWIDRTLWGQAKTLYLRAHPGHEVALVEWVEQVIEAYLDHHRGALISTPTGDEGQIVKITLTPATKQRIIDTVEDHSIRGRAISRSAVINAALRRAVADAGGRNVPTFHGRLPRGRRPRS